MNPIYITNYLTVPMTFNLTVMPGCEIRFNPGATIYVDRTLIRAQGSQAQPIIFTSSMSSPQPGSWGSIIIVGPSNTYENPIGWCGTTYKPTLTPNNGLDFAINADISTKKCSVFQYVSMMYGGAGGSGMIHYSRTWPLIISNSQLINSSSNAIFQTASDSVTNNYWNSEYTFSRIYIYDNFISNAALYGLGVGFATTLANNIFNHNCASRLQHVRNNS
eukprot:TRINITY_DN14457_c0_g1_i1.p1 TRINITY_DN14457_c0_g1~~TRINITY_DN14457_c0_g1_i1.p1  ORF type:complete len:219 (-),score=23.42 TRINITY_DN14457_c0_g1_i1:14-670(-)